LAKSFSEQKIKIEKLMTIDNDECQLMAKAHMAI
jgi:hypothetical protein